MPLVIPIRVSGCRGVIGFRVFEDIQVIANGARIGAARSGRAGRTEVGHPARGCS